MRKESFTIKNGVGLQERAAAMLTDVANRFSCSVTIEYSGRKLNCRSFLSVLSLAVPNGATVSFSCDGIDEDEAILALQKVCDQPI